MAAIAPLASFMSLAIDFGHIQLVRTEMQSAADATALGVMDAYITGGWNSATFAATTYPADNAVDSGSNVAPTVAVTGGSWDASTRTFTANVYNSGVPAVRVTVTRTKANNNDLKVVWGGLIGRTSVDVKVTAIAVQGGGDSAALNIPSRASLYLAGMPAGTITDWGDDLSDATPYRVTGIPVVPGQWLSFTNFSGTTSIYPAGNVGYYGAAGNASMPLHHGQNYNSSPNRPGPENGIADACIPASAVTGLFLNDNAPDSSNSAPTTVDWTQASQANRVAYNDLQLRQPFMVGDGVNSSGTLQRFQVPPGATRMFLSVWDGVQQNNNGGSVTGTVVRKKYAYLVR